MINHSEYLKEYLKRRQTFIKKIGPTGLAILPSASSTRRNGDNTFPFRQESDFYYLTGFEEPDAIAIIAPHRQEGEYILFNREKNKTEEQWHGPHVGQVAACQHFLADQSFATQEFTTQLPALILNREIIYYEFGLNQTMDSLLISCLNKMRSHYRRGDQLPITFTNFTNSLHEMRLIKSQAEIALIQQAVAISANGHLQAMQTCQPGINEGTLETTLLHTFHRQQTKSVAYSPIVSSGENTCILHYVNNNKDIKEGEFVLIDAGAEYQNYAADITRTFPANGRFSPEQRDVYELVLAAQLAAIQTIKPGALWIDAQQAILKILTQGLVDLKILSGSVDQLIETKAYLPFYMHQSGHWLGLDVHDVGAYHPHRQHWRVLEPNMVLTIEPGLYLSSQIPGLAERWHHLGIRIEDDVVVTETGCQILSHTIPKTIDEIEAVMKR